MPVNNVPNSNPAFSGLYNTAGFDGQVTSDFMRAGLIPPNLRKNLINYADADFDGLKSNILEYVKAVYPEDFNNFSESDLGIMMVELVAYMGAVLSFKADATAQELYLPTARKTTSVRKLLELIGVHMRGPNSSKASCSLALHDLEQALVGAETFVISSVNRTINSQSTRDSLPLSYSMYKLMANGDIDTSSLDIELGVSDSIGGLGTTFPLIFLEGMMQVQDGSFSNIPSQQTIYVSTPSVIEGSVVVSGIDGIFNEIDSLFFASGGEDMVFEKRYRDDYSVDLYFGDGLRGRAPLPASEYKVLFRHGGGVRGDIPKEHINATIPSTKLPSGEAAKMIATNNTAGTGGFNAETPDLAKRFGPQWFATQYRAVTGEDYTTFANRYISDQGQVGKALAMLRDNGGAGNMIDIYTLTRASDNQLERANFSFKEGMLSYLNKYKMLTDELTIVDGLVRTLDLVATVFVDRDRQLNSQDIQGRVSSRIQEFFDIVNIDFGTPIKWADLTNHVLEDSAVRFFKVENYSNDIYPQFNEIVQLNNFELNLQVV